VKDRLAGYIHCKSNDAFNQAVLVGKKQGKMIDLMGLAKWCRMKENARRFENPSDI
jgi:hypothetical protein